MATATLVFAGNDGSQPVTPDPPTPGKYGEPLGEPGNGADGTTHFDKCKTPAQPGLPGNDGQAPAPAEAGGNGGSVPAVRIVCAEFSGGVLDVVNHGGNGGHGASAGRGGNGSDGGNAGKQPKSCKDLVRGGVGGAGGPGGVPGNGGDAGSAGDVTVIYGSAFDQIPVSVHSRAGSAGQPGSPGDGGLPGQGGLNSDGTRADSGVANGSGPTGHAGKPGYGGSFDAKQDSSAQPSSLTITIVPRAHG